MISQNINMYMYNKFRGYKILDELHGYNRYLVVGEFYVSYVAMYPAYLGG